MFRALPALRLSASSSSTSTFKTSANVASRTTSFTRSTRLTSPSHQLTPRRRYKLDGEQVPSPASLQPPPGGGKGVGAGVPKSTLVAVLSAAGVAAYGRTLTNEYYKADIVTSCLSPLTFALLAPPKSFLPFVFYNGVAQFVLAPVVFLSGAFIWLNHNQKKIHLSPADAQALKDLAADLSPMEDTGDEASKSEGVVKIAKLLWFFAGYQGQLTADKSMSRSLMMENVERRNPVPSGWESLTEVETGERKSVRERERETESCNF